MSTINIEATQVQGALDGLRHLAQVAQDMTEFLKPSSQPGHMMVSKQAIERVNNVLLQLLPQQKPIAKAVAARKRK